MSVVSGVDASISSSRRPSKRKLGVRGLRKPMLHAHSPVALGPPAPSSKSAPDLEAACGTLIQPATTEADIYRELSLRKAGAR